eukprot:PhM_4_TR18201/c0_g1_i1/m.71641
MRVILVRHGQSIPNVNNVICSQLKNGVHPRNGLSETGRAQALEVGKKVNAMLSDSEDILVISSPFSRAVETTQAIVAELSTQKKKPQSAIAVRIDFDLRERDFGASMEGISDAEYKKVWAAEDDDDAIKAMGVETVESVAGRSARCVLKHMMGKHANSDVVVVAHGDILQILECALAGTDPREHRNKKHLEPAEARLVHVGGDFGTVSKL